MKNSILLLLFSLGVVTGCGKHDEGLAKRAGSTVGETLTDFASGVGKGIDKQMTVTVELSQAFADQGVSKTIAKSVGIGPANTKGTAKGISVYLIATKPFQSKLVARAVTKDGLEIGRSTVDVGFAGDEAKYVTFSFDREMDTQLVDKYTIDMKK